MAINSFTQKPALCSLSNSFNHATGRFDAKCKFSCCHSAFLNAQSMHYAKRSVYTACSRCTPSGAILHTVGTCVCALCSGGKTRNKFSDIYRWIISYSIYRALIASTSCFLHLHNLEIKSRKKRFADCIIWHGTSTVWHRESEKLHYD